MATAASLSGCLQKNTIITPHPTLSCLSLLRPNFRHSHGLEQNSRRPILCQMGLLQRKQSTNTDMMVNTCLSTQSVFAFPPKSIFKDSSSPIPIADRCLQQPNPPTPDPTIFPIKPMKSGRDPAQTRYRHESTSILHGRAMRIIMHLFSRFPTRIQSSVMVFLPHQPRFVMRGINTEHPYKKSFIVS